MSLIIEDKTALDSLANDIIGANKSITDSSATKSELIEMINNIIPEKSKFSSGIFTPATEITADNMPEIPFNFGTDNNGDIIVPDMILIYQPQSILENTGNERANLVTQIFPHLIRGKVEEPPGYIITMVKAAGEVNNKISALGQSTNISVALITDSSFFLYPRKTYSWQAQMPIVWLQIKF